MRKLASIQIVSEKRAIENADAIEVVTVLGWHVVTKKDEFLIGDKCVYCEIDSIMPQRPEFEFLKKTKYKIRTCKLRGQISQGICFPMDILPIGDYEIDQDVTDLLGVTKYEPEALVEFVRGTFPTHLVPKTDETRVQVLQKLLSKYQGVACYVTEKIDGTSATYIRKEDDFMICSRNQICENDAPNVYVEIARTYNIEEKLRTLGKNIAIQGEIIGEGIQSNKYKIKGHVLKVFNIYDIDLQKYLDYNEFISLASILKLDTVDVIDDNFILSDDIEALVELSKGKSKLCNIHREGIVIRPLTESNDFTTGRVSFKSINPEFLLKYES